MATHSSILAWRIPGTEEPGGLPALVSHRVAHGWSDLAAAASILAWKSHGWGLVNYSPWGRKKSERIERLHFHFHSFLSCSLMVHLILCIYNFIFSICTLIAGFDLCLLWSSYILTYNYTTYFKLIII